MELTDQDYETIINDAYSKMRDFNFKNGVRGQTLTEQDGIDYWIVKATVNFIENKMSHSG